MLDLSIYLKADIDTDTDTDTDRANLTKYRNLRTLFRGKYYIIPLFTSKKI
jgi:hypothetical protein